jgi:hypothetical protein
MTGGVIFFAFGFVLGKKSKNIVPAYHPLFYFIIIL